MIVNSPVGRAAALGGLLLLSGVTAMALSDQTLTRDRGFGIRVPGDGARIESGTLFSWTSQQNSSTYAVLVDATIPRPGAFVAPTDRILTVTGTSVRLTLGRAKTGSPSARGFHTVTVLPLDGQGRRLGSSAAVVHVRER